MGEGRNNDVIRPKVSNEVRVEEGGVLLMSLGESDGRPSP